MMTGSSEAPALPQVRRRLGLWRGWNPSVTIPPALLGWWPVRREMLTRQKGSGDVYRAICHSHNRIRTKCPVVQCGRGRCLLRGIAQRPVDPVFQARYWAGQGCATVFRGSRLPSQPLGSFYPVDLRFRLSIAMEGPFAGALAPGYAWQQANAIWQRPGWGGHWGVVWG